MPHAGGQIGFVDKTGKIIITPQFTEVCPFVDGLSLVEVATKIGVIDRSGRFVWGPMVEQNTWGEGGLPCPR